MKWTLLLGLLLLTGCTTCEAELDAWCGDACRSFDATVGEAHPVDGDCPGRPFAVVDCAPYRIVRVTGFQVTDSYFDANGVLVGVTQTSDGVYACDHGLTFGEVPACTPGAVTAYCDD